MLFRMFQSSPGQKAGCNLTGQRHSFKHRQMAVSILTRPEGRVQPPGVGICRYAGSCQCSFQSSPGQKAGCNNTQRREDLRGYPSRVSILTRPEGRVQQAVLRCQQSSVYLELVSILTRPEGRVQPWAGKSQDPNRPRVFQSSPGQKAGCNSGSCWCSLVRLKLLFQSSPGQKAGCNHGATIARPLRRAWRGFNPHPARRPGATIGSWTITMAAISGMFQSSPGQKAGCNRRPAIADPGAPATMVSILTRPEGRVQPWNACQRMIAIVSGTSFNPHPARRPGATLDIRRPGCRPRVSPRFQSSPGQKAGCNGNADVDG